ncbi:MAG: hypothetical protein JSW26_27030 [Desulfobacterales bacterium]|nr:MAG: hypothetical protein JSW26_27030 [Desulfobacterales bacterium]
MKNDFFACIDREKEIGINVAIIAHFRPNRFKEEPVLRGLKRSRKSEGLQL